MVKFLDVFLMVYTFLYLLGLLQSAIKLRTSTREKMCNGRTAQQGHRYHKLRKTFSNFYRRHYKLICKFNVGLKALLLDGLSQPEFNGDLVYKFKKLIGRNDFSFQLRKIIMRYKRIGYNLNVMYQFAC